MSAHGLDRTEALAHYNNGYRHRFHLRALRDDELPTLPPLDDTLGLPDRACAAIARAVVDATPRYVVGTIVNGTVYMADQDAVPPEELEGCNVIVENPRGGIDNWSDVSRLVRDLSLDHHEEAIALLAIREEDEPGAWALGFHLIATSEYLPHDDRAEAAYIYRVSEDTIGAYQTRHRPDLKRPASRGRPKK